MNIKEPTGEQCTSVEKVYEDNNQVGYAMWYPQMGGYVGRSVVILDKSWSEDSNGSRMGGCFEAVVWHDGEFPFSEDDNESPARIHHCCPDQFIRFGMKVKELNEMGKIKEKQHEYM
jgi:hypothetical protein